MKTCKIIYCRMYLELNRSIFEIISKYRSEYMVYYLVLLEGKNTKNNPYDP